jgi:ribose 5-phosphate isomerase A
VSLSEAPSEDAETARQKQQAAVRAVEYVQSGMVVGLGAGSTALLAVRRIGHLLRQGRLRDIVGVPCSSAIEAEARSLGIPITLDLPGDVDLTIDGADEVDPELNLIKGGGGALLHEKIVAQASRREIIVVDESKLSPALGTHWPLPVEVIPFGWHSQRRFLESLGAHVTLRQQRDGAPFKTDEGNLILDCGFGPIPQPAALAARLKARTGIVEHGLFIGLATEVIVAGAEGVRHLTPQRAGVTSLGKPPPSSAVTGSFRR